MNRFFSSRYFGIIPILFFVFLWFLTGSDPFFGDAISSTSRAAVHIYNNNLGTLFYPAYADPGHPTLYTWLLAALWMLFGETLAVSHLYSLAWLAALLLVFRKLAGLYLVNKTEVNKAVLLFLLMPTVLSQGAMMLNTLAVVTFFMAAMYGMLSQNRLWLITGGILMMITHLQAPFFLLSLAATDFVIHKGYNSFISWIKTRWLSYFLPFVALCIWHFLHYTHAGWLVQSPNYHDADQLNGLVQFIKSLLKITWRLVDFGMLPLYFIFLFAMVKGFGTKALQRSWIMLTAVTAIPLAIVLENTIGHRYFLPFAILMIIVVCDALQHLELRSSRVLYLLCVCALFAGNWLYYPGKNMGDGNLCYRGYFRIERQLRQHFQGMQFYSHAPLANPASLTWLYDEGLLVSRIDTIPLSTLPAVLQSNVNAEFSEDDKALLAKGFYAKSYESGAVFVNVFLNPLYYKKPEGWVLRTPGAFERWMNSAKQQMKAQ